MSTDDKKILLESLWKMYMENTTHARHLETQRSTVSNLILVLVGAIITLVTVDKHVNHMDLPAIVLLFGIGLFGIIFSAKHYLTYRNHMERAKYYRLAIDNLLPNIDNPEIPSTDGVVSLASGIGILTALKEAADNSFKKRSRSDFLTLMNETRIYRLWIILFILVLVIAVFLGTVAIVYPSSWAQ